MLYDIRLTMSFHYAGLAGSGRHAVRVMPRGLGHGQRLVAGSLDVTGRPRERADGTDFFGNPVTDFTFDEAEDEIEYRLQARVERGPGEDRPDLSPPLGRIAAESRAVTAMDGDAPVHFLHASPLVMPHAGIAEYARAIVSQRMTVFEAASRLNAAIHADMRYDSDATTVDTPLAEAFEARHGVCQDFSHIMIAALRGLGVPAAYVSGFLRTVPPKGRPRLEGADAMHAWVRAWCGGRMGWVEFDPTNDRLAGADHVVVGYGRDYADVAPVRGVIRTAGGQRVEQAVDVVPVVQAASSLDEASRQERP